MFAVDFFYFPYIISPIKCIEFFLNFLYFWRFSLFLRMFSVSERLTCADEWNAWSMAFGWNLLWNLFIWCKMISFNSEFSLFLFKVAYLSKKVDCGICLKLLCLSKYISLISWVCFLQNWVNQNFVHICIVL